MAFEDSEEKLANAWRLAHQRQELMEKACRLTNTLIDIRELVDGYADVDDGQPNLAMRILTLVNAVLPEETINE